MLPKECDVVVIGAGLAGLATARALSLAGRDVQVVEASDGIGGRVRTDNVDGLLLGRGFQLCNPSYVEGARILDLEALDLHNLTPGILVSLANKSFELGDPRRNPLSIADSLMAPIGSLAAKLKFSQYALKKGFGSTASDAVDQRTGAFLDFAFGEKFSQTLLRPFLAGVFLEDELQTSKRFFDIVLRAFVRRTPSLPANGMGAIPAQLAAQLPEGSIHLNTKATNISATLVRTSEGDIKCKAVVLATSAASANELVPSFATPQSNSVTTWYHLADCEAEELTGGRSTLVVDGLRYKYGNPDPMRPLVNTVVLSNSVPSYASEGRVLVSSSAVGLHETVDDEKLVRTHLTGLYNVDASNWSHVATYAIKDALPKMTPPHAPSQSVTLAPGVYLAGDYCDVSSINGAFKSARRAAQQLLLEGH